MPARFPPSGLRPVACAVLLALLGASRAVGEVSPFQWVRTPPEEQGVDGAAIARMLAVIQRDNLPIDGFVLVRNDRLIAEAYRHPYAATDLHALYSVSKSFTAALLGIAIEQGAIRGVDERIVDLFGSQVAPGASANLSKMRLRHLLTMSTGQAADSTSRITATADWVRAFLSLPVENEPGGQFVYNSGATFMLSAAIQERTGLSTLRFAERHLFPQLGITRYTWDASPTGVTAGGWGLSLCPRDMARFGLMLLHRGEFDGRQVVPAAWVDEATRKQIDTGNPHPFWGTGYGYQFWQNDFGGFRADGAFGQYIFVHPATRTVAVFTSNLSSNTELPGTLLSSLLLPAMAANGALPPNGKASAVTAGAAARLQAGIPAGDWAPVFTALPSPARVAAGGAATLSAAATGSPAPGYQWFHDGVAIAGATGASFTVADATLADDGEYWVLAGNRAGVLASTPVRLEVLAAPAIAQPPLDARVAAGNEIVLRAGAGGGDLAYSWTRDGVPLPGAAGPLLRLPAATATAAGAYRVTVTNPRGSVTSTPVAVRLEAPDRRAHLVALSTRAPAGSGDATLIVGVSIQGPDAAVGLPVLFRGVGPSLAGYGVGRPLADPSIVLHDAGRPIAANGDWRGDADLTATGARLGLAPVAGEAPEAALLATLAPRNYTLHLTNAVPGQDGTALAEFYDAGGTPTAHRPRLAALATRATAGAGDATLIAGFVVAGEGTLRVLVRGLGPALVGQGVPTAIADPELKVFHDDALLAANNDWGGAAELAAAFAQVGAAPLAAGSRDAALVLALPAGVYTAHVSNRTASAGVALIEVYALP